MKRSLSVFSLAILLACAPLAVVASQAPPAGNARNGKVLYDRHCQWCHGRDGAGDGPAAAYLNPPPRDFTMGTYKWKSTPFDEIMPADADYYGAVSGTRGDKGIPGWNGLAGTSMPGWGDVLSDADISDVTAYIKSFAMMEAPKEPSVVFPKGGAPSKEEMEKGRRLYLDRCSECHGREGRGDARKRLKDDWDARTWPRDLTKGWTFRKGDGPGEVYERITVGIPGTQMPSFADPVSTKVMTDAERRDVAYYVAGLDEPEKRPGGERVVRALRTEGALPGPTDARWEKAPYTNLFLVPQIIAGQKLYTPTLDAVSVKAMYNGTELAVYLEWDDRTQSVPGVKKAQELAVGGQVYPDAAAVEFPAVFKKGGLVPYFGMGSGSGEVSIWSWESHGKSPDAPGGSAGLLSARGYGDITKRDASKAGLTAEGSYGDGRWRVVFKRPLEAASGDGPRFEPGVFTPVAFAAWDGSNNETCSRHTMTGWTSIWLEPGAQGSAYIWPVVIALIVFGMELLWLQSARRK